MRLIKEGDLLLFRHDPRRMLSIVVEVERSNVHRTSIPHGRRIVTDSMELTLTQFEVVEKLSE